MWFRAAAGLLAGLCLGAGESVRGDELVRGSTKLERIRIVDLDGGDIAYRTPGGEFRLMPITEVDRLQVDTVGTLADLNEAELRQSRGDFVRAERHYVRATRVASGFWERLVRARFIQAADRAGRMDIIATQFAALLDDENAGPVLAAELLPRSAPTVRSPGMERARSRIEGEIEQATSQSARVLLELLRFQMVDGVGGGNSGVLARKLMDQPIPPIVGTRSVYRVKAAALRRLAADGSAAEVLRIVDGDIGSVAMGALPELLLVKGEVLFEWGRGEAAVMRAGLAAMRLVIHFPEDELVPAALVLAARVHERMDRVPTALKLLEECVGLARITATMRARAEAEMTRLRSAG